MMIMIITKICSKSVIVCFFGVFFVFFFGMVAILYHEMHNSDHDNFRKNCHDNILYITESFTIENTVIFILPITIILLRSCPQLTFTLSVISYGFVLFCLHLHAHRTGRLDGFTFAKGISGLRLV